MQFEVIYGERTYGTGYDAPQYKVHIKRQKSYRLGKLAEDVSINFNFSKPAQGKSDPLHSDAYVKSGRLNMSKEEALKLAQGIISFLFLEDEYDQFIIECNDGKYALSR